MGDENPRIIIESEWAKQIAPACQMLEWWVNPTLSTSLWPLPSAVEVLDGFSTVTCRLRRGPTAGVWAYILWWLSGDFWELSARTSSSWRGLFRTWKLLSRLVQTSLGTVGDVMYDPARQVLGTPTGVAADCWRRGKFQCKNEGIFTKLRPRGFVSHQTAICMSDVSGTVTLKRTVHPCWPGSRATSEQGSRSTMFSMGSFDLWPCAVNASYPPCVYPACNP